MTISSTLHDIFVGFGFMFGLIFSYLFFLWCLKWFSSHYEIKEKKHYKE